MSSVARSPRTIRSTRSRTAESTASAVCSGIGRMLCIIRPGRRFRPFWRPRTTRIFRSSPICRRGIRTATAVIRVGYDTPSMLLELEQDERPRFPIMEPDDPRRSTSWHRQPAGSGRSASKLRHTDGGGTAESWGYRARRHRRSPAPATVQAAASATGDPLPARWMFPAPTDHCR